MAAPTIELISRVKAFVEDENGEKNISLFVRDIEIGELKLLDLVAALMEPLTSKDVVIRHTGTLLLANVIVQLPPNCLLQNEVIVLTEFFRSRLGDHHSITATVLKGLSVLSINPVLPGIDAEGILHGIFKEVTVQTLAQSDRLVVYNIIEYFLDHRIEDIRVLGADMVLGVVQAVDGEKDPRNLMSVFRIVRKVAQNFSLGVLAEELFEVVACYFPIDFSPLMGGLLEQITPVNDGRWRVTVHNMRVHDNNNDPTGFSQSVTKEMLIDSLRGCFAASPAFAEFCLPLLLEKLSSSIADAKIDALETLAVVSSVYMVKTLEEFAGGFWSLIRNEVFSSKSNGSSGETKLERTCLTAVTALVRALVVKDNSSAATANKKDTIIDEIFRDCSRYLQEPDQLIFHQSGKLLAAAAAASSSACAVVVRLTIPLFISEFNLHHEPSHRQNLLDFVLSLLKVCASPTSSALFEQEPVGESPLLPFNDDLYGLFVSLLSNVNSTLRHRSVLALAGLLAAPQVINDGEKRVVAEHLLNLILTDADANVRQECLSVASYLSSENPSIVVDCIRPKLIEYLNHTDSVCLQSDWIGGERKSHVTDKFLLGALARISTNSESVELNIPVYINYLAQIQGTVTTVDDADERLSDALECCVLINSIVSAHLSSVPLLQYFVSRLLIQCHGMLIAASSVHGPAGALLRHVTIINEMATTVRLICQTATSQQILSSVSYTCEMFLRGNLQSVKDNGIDIPDSFNFKPIHVGAVPEQTNLIVLFTASVCSLRDQAILENWLNDMIQQLFTFCLHHSEESAVLSAAQCIAALVNKMTTEEQVDVVMERIQKELQLTLSSPLAMSDGLSLRRAAIVWVWLTKALLLRNHSRQTTFITQLVSMLDNVVMGEIAAEGFHIVLSNLPHIMNETSHARITLFYRQRFFTLTVATLVARYRSLEKNQKQYYLLALSKLVQHVPREVILPELPQLLPILLQSLSVSTDMSLLLPTLDTLSDLIRNSPDIIDSYIDDIVPRLIALSAYKPSMKIRISALQCIGLLPSLVEHRVLPQKRTILVQILPALDDHKRLVRQAAASAREKWFLLGASVEEK